MKNDELLTVKLTAGEVKTLLLVLDVGLRAMQESLRREVTYVTGALVALHSAAERK